MKTIKLPYYLNQETEISDKNQIAEIIRIQSSMIRFSFNRFQEGLAQNIINRKINNLFKEKIGSWLLASAVAEAKTIHSSKKDVKVVFGGKSNFKKYHKNLISKEELKIKRSPYLSSLGESDKSGNRLFKFDFENSKIIFKLDRKNHITLNLPKLRNNLGKELNLIQELINNKKITLSVKLFRDYLTLTYDESLVPTYKKFSNLKENRILGLDLNPDFIGISILEFSKDDKFKIIKKQYFDLKELNKKEVSSNKRSFEIYEICYSILKLCNEYNVKNLAIEDLSCKLKDFKKGKNLNRKNNNCWMRSLISQKLKMLSGQLGVNVIEVNPAYSSMIGNIAFGNINCPDMIASSIEVARRAYKKFEKNWFYLKLSDYVEKLENLWKDSLDWNIDDFKQLKDWKELFLFAKNSKLKYRISIEETLTSQKIVFRKSSCKSKVLLYSYI